MLSIKSLRCAALALLLVGAAGSARAADALTATAEEVVAKVKEAAEALKKDGEAALDRFRGKDSAFVWKDTYVFVSDCQTGVLLTHPFQPEREGKKIADGPAYGGVTAAQRAEAQCTVAMEPGGGWYEYPFPKPGQSEPARKVSYILAVEGQPYIVGAGIYDADATIADLKKLSAPGG